MLESYAMQVLKTPEFWGSGDAYPKNRDQIINVAFKRHASAEDTRVLGVRDAYPKNRDQIINVGMIRHVSAENTRFFGGGGGTGHTSSEDRRVLGGPGAYSLGEILKFEVFKLLVLHWNGQFHHHHVILNHFNLNLLRSLQTDLFGS